VSSPRWGVGLGIWGLGFSCILFVLLATANAAGYRYGTSDQAFYIPAVVRALQETGMRAVFAYGYPWWKYPDEHQDDWITMWFRTTPALTLQMVSKGSVAVDGVSLTLVEVTDDTFSIALIPHTLKVTTLGRRQVGDVVNIETDLLGKYVQKLMMNAGAPA